MQNSQQIIHPNPDYVIGNWFHPPLLSIPHHILLQYHHHSNSEHVVVDRFHPPSRIFVPYRIILQYYLLPHSSTLCARYYALYAPLNRYQHHSQADDHAYQSTTRRRSSNPSNNRVLTRSFARIPQNCSNGVIIKNHVNVHRASLKVVAEKQNSGQVLLKLSFTFDANLPGR
jgi:hypothetical protein